RVICTIEAIREDLMVDGFVLRYRTDLDSSADRLPGKEGAFLACSFWMANALLSIGREEEANELFERLLSLRNDVGLLAEEWDPREGRQVGNFPQAFSHVPLVTTALNLADKRGGWRTRQHTRAVLNAPRSICAGRPCTFGDLLCNRRTRAVGTSGAEHRRICPDGHDVVRLDLRLQTHAQRIGHVDLEVQDFPQGRGLLPFDLVVEVDGKGHRLPRSGVVVQADRGGEGVPVTAEVVLRPGNTPAEAPFGGAQHTVVIVTVHLRTSRPPAAVLGLDRVHLGQEHLVAARYGLLGRLL